MGKWQLNTEEWMDYRAARRLPRMRRVPPAEPRSPTGCSWAAVIDYGRRFALPLTRDYAATLRPSSRGDQANAPPFRDRL